MTNQFESKWISVRFCRWAIAQWLALVTHMRYVCVIFVNNLCCLFCTYSTLSSFSFETDNFRSTFSLSLSPPFYGISRVLVIGNMWLPCRIFFGVTRLEINANSIWKCLTLIWVSRKFHENLLLQQTVMFAQGEIFLRMIEGIYICRSFFIYILIMIILIGLYL